jgi:hypothetical protein
MPSSHKYAKIARPCVAPFSFGGYLPFYIFLNLGQDTRAGKDQGRSQQTRTRHEEQPSSDPPSHTVRGPEGEAVSHSLTRPFTFAFLAATTCMCTMHLASIPPVPWVEICVIMLCCLSVSLYTSLLPKHRFRCFKLIAFSYRSTEIGASCLRGQQRDTCTARWSLYNYVARARAGGARPRVAVGLSRLLIDFISEWRTNQAALPAGAAYRRRGHIVYVQQRILRGAPIRCCRTGQLASSTLSWSGSPAHATCILSQTSVANSQGHVVTFRWNGTCER